MEPRPFVFSLERKQIMPPVGPPQPSSRRSARAAAAAAGTIKGIIEGSDSPVCMHIPNCSPNRKCAGNKNPPKHLQSVEMYKVLQPASQETAAAPPDISSFASPGESCAGDPQQPTLARATLPSCSEHTPADSATLRGSQPYKDLPAAPAAAAATSATCITTYPWIEPPPKPAAPLTYSRQQYLQSQYSNIFQPEGPPVRRMKYLPLLLSHLSPVLSFSVAVCPRTPLCRSLLDFLFFCLFSLHQIPCVSVSVFVSLCLVLCLSVSISISLILCLSFSLSSLNSLFPSLCLSLSF